MKVAVLSGGPFLHEDPHLRWGPCMHTVYDFGPKM